MKALLLFPAFVLSIPSVIAKEGIEAFEDKSASVEKEEPTHWAGDFCEWLSDDPGELFREKKNPWISQVELSGRFHYQFGRVEGEDVRGNSFGDSFDEFRRLRLTAKVDFLKYFELEVGSNLVSDLRSRAQPNNSLDFGHDDFDAITLGFDIGKAFGKGPFDDIKLTYGRMKLKIGDEVHTSSNDLLTIERSALANELGGDESRPTGATLELEKDDWTAVFGVFSNEADGHAIANWNDGIFYYGSLEWEPNKRWTLRLDHAHADSSDADTALDYKHATVFSTIYESKRWGFSSDLVYVANNNDNSRDPLREGNFFGGVFTPWVWLVRDRLQLVGRYQYARAEESESLRLPNRYIRGLDLPPTTDLDGGRSDENHSFYLGLNWTLCEGNLNLLSGISHDLVSAPTDNFSATTYLFALRTSF